MGPENRSGPDRGPTADRRTKPPRRPLPGTRRQGGFPSPTRDRRFDSLGTPPGSSSQSIRSGGHRKQDRNKPRTGRPRTSKNRLGQAHTDISGHGRQPFRPRRARTRTRPEAAAAAIQPGGKPRPGTYANARDRYSRLPRYPVIVLSCVCACQLRMEIGNRGEKEKGLGIEAGQSEAGPRIQTRSSASLKPLPPLGIPPKHPAPVKPSPDDCLAPRDPAR
jgi:hypothetical protein